MGRPLNLHQFYNGLIIAHVYGDGGGRIINRQKGSRRYKVNNHTGVYTLVPTDDLGAGQMYIKATDSHGNTYFVKKLTRHLATLVRWTQALGEDWEFANGHQVRWGYNYTANTIVKIENDD